MRAFRICSYWVLASVMIGMVGCSKTDSVDIATGPHKIHIANCEPDKDPVKVKDMEQVKWFADDDGYRITFDKNVPPNSAGVPIPGNETVAPAGSSVTQTIHGPKNCSTAGCYYKYNLTRIKNGVPENTPCLDPGIRIVPGS